MRDSHFSASQTSPSTTPDGASELGMRGTARRRFLTQAGAAGAAAAGLGLLGTTGEAKAHDAPPISFNGARVRDRDVYNFALNLEYLEAEYYLRARLGRGLAEEDTTGLGERGEVTGGRQVNFTTRAIEDYAYELAIDEENHVKALRANLGGVAVARPAINLDTAFTTAARAAGIVGDNETFDPYASEDNFLLGAFIFEDVGVTAYNGGAPFLTNGAALAGAVSIGLVEAYHAATVRTVLFSRGQTTPALIDAANAISALRDAVDSPLFKDQGLLDVNGRANIAVADVNSLAFARTFDEVLNIVYLGGESGDFGFFPNRLNGRIR